VKVLLAVLLGLLVALQMRLWFGDGSLQELSRLRDEAEHSRSEVLRLTIRNQALAAEVDDLKSGMDAIEERARGELGMIDEGETFYQFIREKGNNSWIVVPAAGVGERMGGETPKQYLPLGSASVLQQTLQQLLKVPNVEGVVVVLSAEDTHWSSVAASEDARIHTTVGGSARADSVLAGLQYVLDKSGVDTWVLVHDAARPLIHLSDIQRLTDAVYNSGAIGGILGTPVQDTLKQADEYYCVEKTAAMDNEASDDSAEFAKTRITDEASAMEMAGEQPLLVEALQPNFKITRPVDLFIADAILRSEVSMT